MEWELNVNYWCRICPLDKAARESAFALVPEVGCIDYPIHRGLPVQVDRDEGPEIADDVPILCRNNPRDRKACPICEYAVAVKSMDDEDSKKITRRLRREAHHMCNLYVRSLGGFYRVKFGQRLYEKVTNLCASFGDRDLTDPDDGYDICISCAYWKPKNVTYPADVINNRQRPIGNDGWRTLDPLLSSLNYVKQMKRSEMVEALIEKFGHIQGHEVFGG